MEKGKTQVNSPKKVGSSNGKEDKTLRISPRKRPSSATQELPPKGQKKQKLAIITQGQENTEEDQPVAVRGRKNIDTKEKAIVEVDKKKGTSVQYKCTFKLPVDLALMTFNCMSEEQKKTMEDSPFGRLHRAMAMGNIRKENLKEKPNRAIFHILSRYNSSTKKFLLGEKEVAFTPEDVALLLGMPMDGQEYEAFPSNANVDTVNDVFLKKYFGSIEGKGKNKSVCYTSTTIEDGLLKAIRTKAPGIEYLRLWIMYLAATLLFASSAGYSVISSFYHNLQTERMISRVSWPRAIHSFMMRQNTQAC